MFKEKFRGERMLACLPEETADLVAFTQEMLMENFIFLFSVSATFGGKSCNSIQWKLSQLAWKKIIVNCLMKVCTKKYFA